jgi:hypothetical protein
MIIEAETKKYIFIGLLILLLGGLAVGYKSWKNRTEAPKSASESPIQTEACQAIIAEEIKETAAEPIPEPETAPETEKPAVVDYPLHQNITATVFWVGESASDDNNDISNSPSAWDEQWKKHYGGTDSATKRKGFLPSKFCPKENPFYAALPYNDFGKNGKHKAEIFSLVPWAKDKNIPQEHSVLKNRWIKIMHAGKIAYAQWEDVGPFEEDDEAYVFGSAAPKSQENKNAGIDVSPAVRDYLGLSGEDKVDWQFVDFTAVPDGVWKKIITASQVYWK